MTLFTDLKLPLSVKTSRSDPIQVFFTPVLRCASTYHVAVGYFSSAWVRDAAEGVARFASNGGRARWIVSPNLSADDYKLLKDGEQLSPAKVDQLITSSFSELFHALQTEVRTVIAWLIRDGLMEFRVGVPKNDLSGIMHAKTGVFVDSEGNKIGFNGSYNFTSSANTNWETVSIFCAWRSEEARDRIYEIETDFREMWRGADPNLEIFLPTESALEPFIRETLFTERPYKPAKFTKSDPFRIPDKYLIEGQLRPYQLKAIEKWFERNGRGILSMATGSGKTVTALSALTRLANHVWSVTSNIIVVITAPYIHLADQWAISASEFGFDPIICYGGSTKWEARADAALTGLFTGASRVAVFVAVNDTFLSDQFQQRICGSDRNLLLIADEMHHLGAMHARLALPKSAKFRLGLSATPMRHGDEEGTQALEAYFGPVVFEFSLEDAIKHKYLCEYFYYPILCPLNEVEMAEYKELSTKIAQAVGRISENSDGPSEELKWLLMRRARLISDLDSKFDELERLLKERKDSSFNLVYCGDAANDDGKQVNRVRAMVGHTIGMRTNKFTAEESPAERKALLDSFGTGELQVLIAIRCLDEGVDVPRTETAYILASSSNPRQYVQRRGRVLRRSKGKDRAAIYDFIAVPDLDVLSQIHPDVLKAERNLVKRELERINEFAELSLNHGEALARLREIKKRLHLADM